MDWPRCTSSTHRPRKGKRIRSDRLWHVWMPQKSACRERERWNSQTNLLVSTFDTRFLSDLFGLERQTRWLQRWPSRTIGMDGSENKELHQNCWAHWLLWCRYCWRNTASCPSCSRSRRSKRSDDSLDAILWVNPTNMGEERGNQYSGDLELLGGLRSYDRRVSTHEFDLFQGNWNRRVLNHIQLVFPPKTPSIKKVPKIQSMRPRKESWE